MGGMSLRLFRRSRRADLTPNYLALVVLALFAITPMVILGFNALKSNLELGLNPLGPPSEFHPENLVNAWVQGNFGTTMRNSLVLVASTVVGVLVLGGLGAYSLARLNPPGTGAYMTYMLALSTAPIWLYIVPLFILWRKLGLVNNLHGLVLIYIALNSPFAIFLLRSYLLQFPSDLEDAALVDGASQLQVLTKIVLPVMWPAFLTVGLVVGLAVWGEFQIALIFIQDENLQPVTTSYFNFTRRFGRDWALTNAGAVMMIAPVLAVFLALQRRFVEGLTQGGLKF